MADNVQQQAKSAASNVPKPTKGPDGRELTEEEKKQTWSEYGKEVYNEQYERWMPWIEDFYLRWFTKDNKASYATKGACRTTYNSELLARFADEKTLQTPSTSPK